MIGPAKFGTLGRTRLNGRGGRSARAFRAVSLVSALAVVVPLATLAAPSASAATTTRPPVKAPATPTGSGSPSGVNVHHGPGGEIDVNVCPAPAPGHATCLSRLRIDAAAGASRPVGLGGKMTPNTLGDGGAYSPAYLQSAYNAPSTTNGSGQTVAIVDAYDDPNAEADLAAYRSHYGLPDCTTANGCFLKVDQYGGTNYPPPDAQWALEISLDLDMVSAICPNCHILLVEAGTNNGGDMFTAEDEAVTLGATEVSNSWAFTSGWDSGWGPYNTHFDHPGVAITAGSGDWGYYVPGTWPDVDYPAASPDVTAVGGTSLYQATDTGTRSATETAWSGAGSGCAAADEPKPSWQHDTSCPTRTVADVSAVADPATPVWLYDTYNCTANCWVEAGGTSASAPIVAAVYALASGPTGSSYRPAGYPYAQPGSLNDVTSGSTGRCGGLYLCSAVSGYDGPTGLGTPNGIRAFQPSTPSAPQTLTRGSFGGSVLLSWSAPAANGGAPVSAYNIYRADQGSAPIASLGPPATTYTDTGLTNGVTYTYTVKAVNAVGEGSGASASAAPQPLDHLVLSPSIATVTAGGSQAYTANGFDAANLSLGDETAGTSFSIAPNGTCSGTVCTATGVGKHIVTGSFQGKAATASLRVNPGPVDRVAISPADATIPPGGSQTYSAQGFDRFGNLWGDVTADTSFSIGPDGTCSGATCTATAAGAHTVTGALTSTAISTRNQHTCALTLLGGVKCWGLDDVGELGNGDTTIRCNPVFNDDACSSTAVDVSGLASGVATMAAGWSSTCAVTTGGGLKCWGGGTGSTGNLGNGALTTSSVPVDVPGLSSGVAAATEGYTQACALTTAGGVKCWGFNYYGELGDGTTTDSWVPVDVPGLSSGVAAVTAGEAHACALTTAGGVKCWGQDVSGQLGNGDFSGQCQPAAPGVTCSSVPVDVSGLTSGVVAISAGGVHTCALTTSGGVKCWGYNAGGQLGNGTTTSSDVPVDVSGLTSGVAAVSAGRESTCALTTAGGVKCWGANDFGGLGNGTTTNSSIPVDVSGLTSGAAAVSVGEADACALTTKGAVKCWGYNVWGQLGNGSTTDSSVPVDAPTATTGTATLTVQASTSADVSITMARSPNPVVADSQLTYTLTVANAGGSGATNVVVTDPLPSPVIFTSATASQGSCSGTTTVSCALGSVASGGSATVTIKVTPVQPGTPSNTATVGATEPDPNSANNSATVSTTVKAQPKTVYVSVTDGGFSATTTKPVQGGTVQWNVLGPAANGAVDGTGMALFDSGSLSPVAYYRFTFIADGQYRVNDELGHHQTVAVPITVSPKSGGTTTSFTVTWSSAAAPAGYAFDVQIQRPGSTAFVNWMTNQTGTSGAFVPDAGTGTYKFRARMRNTGSSAASSYSTAVGISVS